MKKSIIGLFAALILVSMIGCKNNAPGGDSVTRTEANGKFGIYESPYEVGDIVFNDGSATPYTELLLLTDEQKEAAIAIIFYKGTELNNGDDTSTVRTLGVGLKHDKNGRVWCTSNANAYSRKIIAIESEYYKNGSDNLSQIAAFLSNPSNNTTNDTETAANYPAFYYAINYSNTAANLGTSYSNGWYLPSRLEIEKIYENGISDSKIFDIEAAINLCGGNQFGNSWYWSSSQSTVYDNMASSFRITTGDGASGNKDEPNELCAIRSFD